MDGGRPNLTVTRSGHEKEAVFDYMEVAMTSGTLTPRSGKSALRVRATERLDGRGGGSLLRSVPVQNERNRDRGPLEKGVDEKSLPVGRHVVFE